MQFEHPSDLRDPAVVIAFSGWNDAGNAASDSVLHLIDKYPSQEIARIDDERFYDYQATRPGLKLTPDGPFLEWPHLSIQRVAHPDRDLIAVVGPEPSLLWRAYAQELLDIVSALRPRLCLLLGAMLSDTPHTRPLPVSMSTLDTGLQERLQLEELRYEGPVGIVGVVNQMLIAQGLPTASMWVSIPHYVASPPSPKGQEALMGRIEELLGIELEHSDLPVEAEKWTQAVDELSQEDPDVAEYIEQLEEARDASDVESVTGETIAAEFERYLKGKGDQPPPG
ncbi:MAG: PAC2 family protein [Arachnia sp.]